MNWKFVMVNMYRFIFIFVSLSLITAAAQYLLYTSEKTDLMKQWCFYMGVLFGSMESVIVYLASLKFQPIKAEEYA